MTKPFFSIIIPALNEEKYLHLLLSDLAGQTFRDFEVIVVDAHSEDKTVPKAKAYQDQLPSLQVIPSPKRHVCVQRNLGAKHARANWLIFMDADNRLPVYFLQGVKYRLESDPSDLATTLIESETNSKKDQAITAYFNFALRLAIGINYVIFPESMVITQKKQFLKLGGFNETVNYGESKSLAESFLADGKVFKIYHDPKYRYSFRRLRKFGTMNFALRSAKAQFVQFAGINSSPEKIAEQYPMLGGSFFDQP